MKRSRALIPAVIAAALLITGCTAGGGSVTKDASGEACLAAGSASDSVKVDGKAGGPLKLTSKTPVQSDSIERTVLTEGSGDVIGEEKVANLSMTYFNGSNGEVMQQVPMTPITNSQEQLLEWAYEAVRCGAPGQRVAMVVPAPDVLGKTVEEAGLEDMKDTDSFVVVIDFAEGDATAPEMPGAACDISGFDKESLLARAGGKAKPAPEGFPTVELDNDGAPTITMPTGAAPDKLEIATLIEGDGEVVKPGDCVAVNYRGVIWSTGEEFDSSWSKGSAIAFSTTGVIGGFQQALEGQKVGSQIISVVPAEDGGYGGAQLEQMGHKADEVMVFVLDIVGVKSAEEAK